MDAIRRLFDSNRFVAIGLLTVLTLGMVGTVIVTTTSVGCGASNKLGLKTMRCPASLVASKNSVSGTPSPSPVETRFAPTNPPPTLVPPPSALPASSAVPPPPAPNSASSSAPPLASAASGLPANWLSCRLPVYANTPGSGGFIVLPDNTFVADPRSAGTVPSPSPGIPTPTPAPGGGGYPGAGYPGWYGLTYDAAYAKWLAVPYRWMSPDGVHYSYPLGGDLYVQNVKDGSHLELAQGQSLNPIGVENDGVYAANSAQGGLWFLPYSGSAKQVATSGFWQGIGRGAAYGTPTSAVPQGATNTIIRLDLASGAVSPYFSQSGQSSVIGFDAQGYPLILTNYGNAQAIFIVSAPNNVLAIAYVAYGPYVQPAPFPTGTPIADTHGIWFSVNYGQGIVLYSNGSWYWASSIGGQLAGTCS